jgi:hypothetical protein
VIRKFLLALLAFGFLIFASIHFALAQDDEEFENLLQNPDFENMGQAPWSMWVEGQDAGAGAMMQVTDDESYTGDHSLLIDIFSKGNGQRVELHQNPIVVEKGQQLTYAFWAKTEEGGLVEGRMIMNHRADPWTSYGSKNIKITEEWQEFYVAANIPADDPIAGIYVELKDSAEVMVWFDHFRLYEGEYFEEEEGGGPKIAVEPNGRLLYTWSAIKSIR